MKVLQFIPLFSIILFTYWGLHFTGTFPSMLDHAALEITLPSAAISRPRYADLMVIFGIIILFIELFKSTQTSQTSIVDHILSTFVFIAFLVCWLIYPWAGHPAFFIITMMSFLDVIAGFTITISAARRDVSLG